MTINDRIKYLRKEVLQLNQTDFAEAIGLKQRSVSSMEQNGTVTDRVIKSIRLVFNISEEWLRHGTGPLYAPEATFSLDKFAAEHGASELELEILKVYFELEPDIRRALLAHFRERFSRPASEASSPSQPAEAAQEAVPTAQLTPVVPAERPRRTAIVAARNGIRMEIELTCTDEEEEAAQPPPIVDCDI